MDPQPLVLTDVWLLATFSGTVIKTLPEPESKWHLRVKQKTALGELGMVAHACNNNGWWS